MTPKKTRCPICRVPHTRAHDAVVRVLRRTPGALARIVERARRRELARRPGPRQWAVNEVLSHLADAEIALAFRIRKIAAEPNAELPAWDQDVWADRLRYRRADAAADLDVFQALRRANLGVLGRLTRGQRQQTGRHPEYGRISIDQVLAHWAEHDLGHTRQIRKTLHAASGRR